MKAKEFRIFPAGTFREEEYTPEKLQKVADEYNSRVKDGYEAPLSYGHDDISGAEAAGWIKGLSFKDGFLRAVVQPTKQLTQKVKDGLIRNLSAEFNHNKESGDISFRRLSALGSMPPYHKNIDALAFSEDDGCISYWSGDNLFCFNAPETGKGDNMPEPKETVAALEEAVKTDEGKGFFRSLFAGFKTEAEKEKGMDQDEKQKFDDLQKELDELKSERDKLAADSQAAELKAKAEAFADKRIAEKKAVPAQRDALIELFSDLGEEKAIKYADQMSPAPKDLDKKVIDDSVDDSKLDEGYAAFKDIYSDESIKAYADKTGKSYEDAERDVMDIWKTVHIDRVTQ
jgi:hypothetical protein